MSTLQPKDKVLCAVYGVLAVVALVATWWNNIAFVLSDDNGGLAGFILGGYANHAAASLTNDVILVAVVALVFIFVEGMRLGIRRLWIYPILSVFVAISVAVPVFLIVRQVRLARFDKLA